MQVHRPGRGTRWRRLLLHPRITLREQDRLFAREVAEEGSGADIGGGGDIGHGRFVVAVALKQVGCSINDGLAGAGSLALTGRQIARVPMPASRSTAGNREVEVPRSDLAAILTGAASGDAEFLFDDEIVALHQDEHGVDVTFDRAAARRFDLVIGADGLHSAVRRLAFGPEPDFVKHLGLYVATMPLGEPVDHPHDVLLHNTPGRLVSIHPARGNALAAFIFRGPPINDLDHRDTEQHKHAIGEAYTDVGWRVPELLGRLHRSPDLYFGSVSQVRLSTWSRDRVALLGDAASCVSLFGDGSSLAMAAAYTLAEAVAGTTDHTIALRQYETTHRVLTGPKQRNVGLVTALLVPKTRRGITANLAARASEAAAQYVWTSVPQALPDHQRTPQLEQSAQLARQRGSHAPGQRATSRRRPV